MTTTIQASTAPANWTEHAEVTTMEADNETIARWAQTVNIRVIELAPELRYALDKKNPLTGSLPQHPTTEDFVSASWASPAGRVSLHVINGETLVRLTFVAPVTEDEAKHLHRKTIRDDPFDMNDNGVKAAAQAIVDFLGDEALRGRKS